MANNKDFTSEIIEMSREFSAKEKVMLKDTQDAIGINNAVLASDNSAILIDVDAYAVIHIHNEKAEGDKDYNVIVLIDKDGQKYTTGSTSFMRQFSDIWDDMSESDEPWQLKVYGRPSKNYTGRDYITCSVI